MVLELFAPFVVLGKNQTPILIKFIYSQMQIQIFPVGCGDSLLVSIGNYHLLIDGGIQKKYSDNLKPYLQMLHAKGQVLSKVIVTHLDNDHIGGILSLLEENGNCNTPKIIGIKEIWHNSYRHIRTTNQEFAALTEVEKERLEAHISLLATKTASKGGFIGARQSMALGRLIKNGDYPYNLDFNQKSITIENRTKIKIKNDICLELLSPNQDKLSELAKDFESYLYEIGVNHKATDELIEDAYDLYIRKKQKKKESDAKDIAASIMDDTITIQKIIDYSKKKYEQDKALPNGSSIAFILHHTDKETTKTKKVLFLADAHAEIIIEQLTRIFPEEKYKYPILFDAIKVAHHGSANNNDPKLFQIIDSQYFIFSTNGHNKHPNLETIARIVNRPCPTKDFKRNLIFNYKEVPIAARLDKKDLKDEFNYEILHQTALNL